LIPFIFSPLGGATLFTKGVHAALLLFLLRLRSSPYAIYSLSRFFLLPKILLVPQCCIGPLVFRRFLDLVLLGEGNLTWRALKTRFLCAPSGFEILCPHYPFLRLISSPPPLVFFENWGIVAILLIFFCFFFFPVTCSVHLIPGLGGKVPVDPLFFPYSFIAAPC